MWSDDDKWILGGLAAGVLLLWGKPIVNTVVDVVSRGTRLTVTSLDVNGISGQPDPDNPDNLIPSNPSDLVDQASAVLGTQLDADTYALARMARSEGIAAGDVRIHVALNDLADLNSRKSLGWSPQDLITYSTNSAARGFFGSQSGRRYASSQDPYAGDVTLVQQTVAQHNAGIDPTGGAIKFVDKSSFGVQAGTGSYAATVASWAQEGLQPFNVPGYDDDFVVFRRA
jgi:hypothetical protein